MSDTDNTTSNSVIDSAKSGTMPGALSAASVTEAPAASDTWTGGIAPDGQTTSPPALNDDQPNRDDTTDKEDAAADHETRLQRLEDEIAFLREMFGWPTK